MRKINIGFSKSSKFMPLLSWSIRFFQGVDFSHVYIRQDTKWGVDLVYQASGAQVNFMSGPNFLRKNKVVREFQFEVSEDSYNKYMKFALKNVGAPYSIGQIFGILFLSLFSLRKNPITNSSRSYVCSELVAEILYELGKFNIDRSKLNAITPKDIYELCEKYSRGE